MEAVGQLTGGIAHDFNNLLQVIIGNLQLMRGVIDSPDKVLARLEVADASARKARALTQQLLAFSRKQALENRIANIGRVVGELQEILQHTLGNEHKLEVDIGLELPNIDIDTVQLELALINIVANARDAMGGKGGTITIQAEVPDAERLTKYHDAPNGEFIELRVRDTGTGMEPEVLEHVTEPFFTTKEVGKGTGLGMAQVYGFIKQSNGHLHIESELGKGTSICLLFKQSDCQSPPEDHDRVQQHVAKEDDDRSDLTVLVVDDTAAVRQLAIDILEQEGYHTLAADNAESALKLLQEHGDSINLIFSDIIMPGGMTGIDLAQHVREHYMDMPILLTTGYAETTHGKAASSIEFETILKPFMPDDLIARVRQLLYRKGDHHT